MAAVIAAGAAVLATRLILLLAVLGAFALAVMALRSESIVALCVLIAYSICVLLPIVGVEIKTKWGSG